VVPVEDVTNFTNSIPNSSLELFSGANHLFQGKSEIDFNFFFFKNLSFHKTKITK